MSIPWNVDPIVRDGYSGRGNGCGIDLGCGRLHGAMTISTLPLDADEDLGPCGPSQAEWEAMTPAERERVMEVLLTWTLRHRDPGPRAVLHRPSGKR